MPTIDELQTQVRDFEAKALDYMTTVQQPVVEYVHKAAAYVADTLPAERPEALVGVIDAAAFQAGFAKKVIDAQAVFAKKMIDAAVKPFTPAKKRTVKAA
jgi:hypothetical protein